MVLQACNYHKTILFRNVSSMFRKARAMGNKTKVFVITFKVSFYNNAVFITLHHKLSGNDYWYFQVYCKSVLQNTKCPMGTLVYDFFIDKFWVTLFPKLTKGINKKTQ